MVAAIFVIGLMTASLASFVADLPDYADAAAAVLGLDQGRPGQIGINVNDLLTLQNIDPKTVLSTGAVSPTGVVGLLSDLSLWRSPSSSC